MSQPGLINVFLDCGSCDFDFIKRDITFVNFVRDIKFAQVDILVTSQATGSNNEKYFLFFTGRQNFAGKSDTLVFITKYDATSDEVRKAMVQKLKLGLIPYLLKSPVADNLVIFQARNDTTSCNRFTVDKWKGWVFTTNFQGTLSGQQLEKSSSYNAGFSASKTTEAWKLNFFGVANYNELDFIAPNATVSSYTNGQNYSALFVKSNTSHLSTGLVTSLEISSFANIKYSLQLAPSAEFDIFPYAQSSKHKFCLFYSLFQQNNSYVDSTIYYKTHETLYGESLTVNFQVMELWGGCSLSLSGSHYFYDISKNHLTFSNTLSVRVFKGFSVNLSVTASLIHDQLSLPKQDASTEEILLQRQQLATSYNYIGTFGITYTFGSIYNNIVNPRFYSN